MERLPPVDAAGNSGDCPNFRLSEKGTVLFDADCSASFGTRTGAVARSGRQAVVRLGGLAVLMAAVGGCGPELSTSDLGHVVFEVPKVSGSEKPYAMPQLGPPLEKSDAPTH